MIKLKVETQRCTGSTSGKETSSERNDDEGKPCESIISDGIMNWYRKQDYIKTPHP
jgi:hypothetical protein